MVLTNLWIQINGSFLSDENIEEIVYDSNLGYVNLELDGEKYELDTAHVKNDGREIWIPLFIPEDSEHTPEDFVGINPSEVSGSIWVEESLDLDLTYQLVIEHEGDRQYYDLSED